MGVRHHRELEAWQLADQVRRSLLELVARPAVKEDFAFCDQASRAANSACRNIAEGFYRFSHREFAHFLNIARGSLGELLDSLDEARGKHYSTEEDLATLERLIERAMAATRGLQRHLTSSETPRT